jgi:hypothetical protein
VGVRTGAAASATCATATNSGAGALSAPALLCANVVGVGTGSTQSCGSATNTGGGSSNIPFIDCANQVSVLGTLDGACPITDVPSNPDDPTTPINSDTNANGNDNQSTSLPATARGSLAFTGASMANALMLGAIALLLGGFALLRGRRTAKAQNTPTE